ncbi:MAG: hypothetical protein OEZ65_16920, partial [Gemmatimonadota bacterium]|nr:hypothetical protein [Gemmatimonadota bacterium]
AADLDAVPDPREHVGTPLALTPAGDATSSVQGLPGSLLLMVADGVPFRRAGHPGLRSEPSALPLFTPFLLSRVSLYETPGEIEWSGGPGGYEALSTLSMAPGEAAVEGSWSSEALWDSDVLEFMSPPVTSLRSGARIGFEPGGASTRVTLAADGIRHQAPFAPRVSPAIAATLSAAGVGGAEAHAMPALDETTRISALARLDAQPEPGKKLFVRGAGGYLERTFGNGGPVVPDPFAGVPEEAVEFSVAGGYLAERSSTLTLDLRGGVSGSRRTFGGGGGPATVLAGSGVLFGDPWGSSGEASRLDIDLIPAVQYRWGEALVTAGLQARGTSHRLSHGFGRDGALLFGSPAALAAGTGSYFADSAPERSFRTGEVGLFAQYSWDAAPGVQLSVGARFDREGAEGFDAVLNEGWLDVSGVRTDSFPSSFDQLGGRMSVLWDMTGDGGTVFNGVVAVDHGDLDPALLYEILSRDGSTTASRFDGPGLSWSAFEAPTGATESTPMTLFGPDMRPPQSTRVTGSVSRRLGWGWNLHLSGSLRRTEFLPRRRDLNLAENSGVNDQFGRTVFGTLTRIGGAVTAVEGTGRRFPGFGAVYALDPDGWSEYKGITVGVEQRGARSHVFASYTRSTTRDNWLGAAAGRPSGTIPPLVPDETGSWAEGPSDLDVPDRVIAGGTLTLDVLEGISASAVYTYATGLPFTPRYALGVDANGDGSWENDVAYVPESAFLGDVLTQWPCLASQTGGPAARNSCRAPVEQSLHARLRVGLAEVAGRTLEVVVDGFNLIENEGGIVDDALLLVDPAGSMTVSADGTTVTLPLSVNQGFGRVVRPAARGRMLRIGFRIG